MMLLFLSVACTTSPKPMPTEVSQEPASPALPASSAVSEEAPAAGAELASQSVQELAWSLYARSAEETNLFCSPFSLQLAFGMAYAAARGETAEELEAVLGFAAQGDAHHAGLAALSRAVQQADAAYTLHLSSQLWGKQGETFTPSYERTLLEQYQAAPAALNFADPASVDRINQQVAEETEGTIQDLLPAGSLSALTESVLTNAIYFQGDWLTPFDPSLTRSQPFRRPGGEPVPVELMHREGAMDYAEVDSTQVLRLPYQGETLSMVLVLPPEGADLRTLSVDRAQWERWRSALREQTVQLWLPRMKLRWGGDMVPLLKSMGMQRSFSAGAADFSGLYGEPGVYLKGVYHQAFMMLDEQGTEAAAATGAVMGARGAKRPPPRPQFRADRPFLFAIQHDPSGALLFLGRLVDPSAD